MGFPPLCTKVTVLHPRFADEYCEAFTLATFSFTSIEFSFLHSPEPTPPSSDTMCGSATLSHDHVQCVSIIIAVSVHGSPVGFMFWVLGTPFVFVLIRKLNCHRRKILFFKSSICTARNTHQFSDFHYGSLQLIGYRPR
jgi:hypothetical protein